VASGWRTAPAAAERALVTAASRRVHQVLGLRALHPHHARPLDRFTGGAVRVDCGPALCRLALRGEDAAAGGAAAA
jgi:hypothetical protein